MITCSVHEFESISITSNLSMDNKNGLISLIELDDRTPTYRLVKGLDLVIVKYDDEVSVLYGRCLHRGALMADGHIECLFFDSPS